MPRPRKGGAVDAFHSAPAHRITTFALLHTAAANNHLAMVRELLKRGASVDLPTSFGVTALMSAANIGHLSIVLVLLQHSANPDLQDIYGNTALMGAAIQGNKACVQALLRAKANTKRLGPYVSGDHQRGATPVGLQVGVGRVLQEDEHDGEMALVRSFHERGVAKAGW